MRTRDGQRVEQTLLVQELAPGYNCRSYVWLGPARTEAVFGIGSTRNSIDKDYLKALQQEDRTSACVLSIEIIKPLTCRSVDKNNPIVVKQIAYLKVTFKESDQVGTTKDLGFCVVPDSTEDVIIGKPTLDASGFVSDRHSIELRAEDVRFPTILPESLPEGKDQFLCLADHIELDGRWTNVGPDSKHDHTRAALQG